MAIKDMSFDELLELGKRLEKEKEYLQQRVDNYSKDMQAVHTRLKELEIDLAHEVKDAEYTRKLASDATYGFLCNVH